MGTRTMAGTVLLAVSVAGTVAATEAQTVHPGFDRATVSLQGGGFSPTANFRDGSGFGTSATVSAGVTLWLTQFVGVRAGGLFASTDVRSGPEEGGVLAREDPEVWLYHADTVFRLPLPLLGGSTSPYLVAGLGAKTYRFGTLGSTSDVAGNAGVGVEYRRGARGRWGVQLEVRDFISSFDTRGLSRTQNDIVWTGGITLSF